MSAKAHLKHADPFTASLIMDALANLKATQDPVTGFRLGDVEFTITLRRIGDKRVLSKSEVALVKRVKGGQSDLTPSEIRMARRILGKVNA